MYIGSLLDRMFTDLLYCRLHEETRRVQEEVISDLKGVLLEGFERRNSEQTSSSVTETIRSRLWQICRETLSQTVHQAKQEWKKVHKCVITIHA